MSTYQTTWLSWIAATGRGRPLTRKRQVTHGAKKKLTRVGLQNSRRTASK